MDISVGYKIKYTFPDPIKIDKLFVTGIVQDIDEFYVIMLTDNNIRIRINFKNFDNIEIIEESGEINLPKAI